MDRVRLGRALGYGTRHAARTLAAVVEAAAAPNPAPNSSQTSGPPEQPASPTRPQPAAAAAAAAPRPTATAAPASRKRPAITRGLRESFLRPLAVYSGALWLRVTGLFFALIAFSIGSGAWRFRQALHPGASPDVVHRFWLFTVIALLFAYFTVSSFVRANLMERRATTPR